MLSWPALPLHEENSKAGRVKNKFVLLVFEPLVRHDGQGDAVGVGPIITDGDDSAGTELRPHEVQQKLAALERVAGQIAGGDGVLYGVVGLGAVRLDQFGVVGVLGGCRYVL